SLLALEKRDYHLPLPQILKAGGTYWGARDKLERVEKELGETGLNQEARQELASQKIALERKIAAARGNYELAKREYSQPDLDARVRKDLYYRTSDWGTLDLTDPGYQQEGLDAFRIRNQGRERDTLTANHSFLLRKDQSLDELNDTNLVHYLKSKGDPV